jgi:hypothetical protein
VFRTGEERDHIEDGAELRPLGGATSVVALLDRVSSTVAVTAAAGM